MYKAADYTLVNGIITHPKQQILQRWYCSAVHWHLGNVMLQNITFLKFCCFSCVMTQLT